MPLTLSAILFLGKGSRQPKEGVFCGTLTPDYGVVDEYVCQDCICGLVMQGQVHSGMVISCTYGVKVQLKKNARRRRKTGKVPLVNSLVGR